MAQESVVRKKKVGWGGRQCLEKWEDWVRVKKEEESWSRKGEDMWEEGKIEREKGKSMWDRGREFRHGRRGKAWGKGEREEVAGIR